MLQVFASASRSQYLGFLQITMKKFYAIWLYGWAQVRAPFRQTFSPDSHDESLGLKKFLILLCTGLVARPIDRLIAILYCKSFPWPIRSDRRFCYEIFVDSLDFLISLFSFLSLCWLQTNPLQAVQSSPNRVRINGADSPSGLNFFDFLSKLIPEQTLTNTMPLLSLSAMFVDA